MTHSMTINKITNISSINHPDDTEIEFDGGSITFNPSQGPLKFWYIGELVVLNDDRDVVLLRHKLEELRNPYVKFTWDASKPDTSKPDTNQAEYVTSDTEDIFSSAVKKISGLESELNSLKELIQKELDEVKRSKETPLTKESLINWAFEKSQECIGLGNVKSTRNVLEDLLKATYRVELDDQDKSDLIETVIDSYFEENGKPLCKCSDEELMAEIWMLFEQNYEFETVEEMVREFDKCGL